MTIPVTYSQVLHERRILDTPTDAGEMRKAINGARASLADARGCEVETIEDDEIVISTDGTGSIFVTIVVSSRELAHDPREGATS